MDTVLGMARDWSATVDGPAMLLVARWLPILTAASLLPALAARGWLAALAIAGLSLFAAQFDPAASLHETALVALLVPLSAWLMAVGAVMARRRELKGSARRTALEQALHETGHALDRERLWRRSGPAGEETIPDDELQAIVDRIAARLKASRGDATLLPG